MDLILKNLKITNFKNIEQIDIQFSDKINSFVGLNGAGKTNILDAIYFLSFLKSYFNIPDAALIKNGQTYFSLLGEYQRIENKEIIHITFQNSTKIVKRNNKRYKKFSQHIGLLPAVIITPDDSKLITGSGEERRKFMDIVISQADKKYLDALIKYKKVLQQRNSLIKTFAQSKKINTETLEIWDMQLVPLAKYINQARNNFVAEFKPIFQKYYSLIAGQDEPVDITYSSQLNKHDYELLLKQNLQKDIALEYTYSGIHRDDLELKIYGQPVKKYGSQGQQKTFLLAIRFAQFDFILKHLKIKPILLLDDIFDKLDPVRVEKLIHLVADNHFGQIFITHTNKERLLQIFSNIDSQYSIFTIYEGKIIEQHTN